MAVGSYRLPQPLAVTVDRHRWGYPLPLPLKPPLPLPLPLDLPLNPLDLTAFFVHTGAMWAHYAHGHSAHYANGRIMRALWGFGGIAEKTSKKWGARHREISHKRRVSTKKEDQKSLKNFAFSC